MRQGKNGNMSSIVLSRKYALLRIGRHFLFFFLIWLGEELSIHVTCTYLPHISTSSHKLVQEEIFLQSVMHDTNKKECGNYCPRCWNCKNMYFPRGPVSIEKSSSIYLFLKMKVWCLQSLTMRKNAYVKVMMISQQPHLTQNTLVLQSRGHMLINLQ